MKCKSCGAEISETNKFCGMCGAANTVDESSPIPDPTEGAKAESSFDAVREDKNERDEIDDILDTFGKKSDESGQSADSNGDAAAQPSENPTKEDSDADNANSEKNHGVPLQQNENPPGNNGKTGGNPQYNMGGNMPYNGYPQNNPNNYYGQYGGGYPQPAFVPPYPQPYPQNNSSDTGVKGKKTKEKRVVSLGIAVFCIILVLILSAICGYLTEICFRNGVNPLKPNKTHSIILITEDQIEKEIEKEISGGLPNG